MFGITRRKRKAKVIEDEKITRLEEAERELGTLQARGYHATQRLSERSGRNHWRESVERMIRGTY